MKNDRVRIEPITDGELSILEVIWDQGSPTSRNIADVIYDKVNDSKMASVQKLIERLEAKGCVLRDRSERAHRFRALISREDFLRDRMKALADRHCAGSLAPLVTTLLRSKNFSNEISTENHEQLRQLIDELWPSDQ